MAGASGCVVHRDARPVLPARRLPPLHTSSLLRETLAVYVCKCVRVCVSPMQVPNFLARVAQRAALFMGPNGGGTGTGGGSGGGGSSASASPAPPDDPAAALTAVLDELDQLGSEGARRVEVSWARVCVRGGC